MVSVEPVCRRSKYLAREKPRERTKYIYYDTDHSARHTVVIRPRTLPRRIEQMLQRPSQLLANKSAFMYSNREAFTVPQFQAFVPDASQTRTLHCFVSLTRLRRVACGAASHLRLKRIRIQSKVDGFAVAL